MNIESGGLLVDHSGRVVAASPVALALLDRQADEAIGLGAEELLRAFCADIHWPEVQATEHPVCVQQGDRRLSLQWIAAGHGEIAGVIVCHDVTPLLAIEAMNRGLASTAHDLHGPLQTIVTFADLLMEDKWSRSEQQARAKRIRIAGGRLLSLIDNMLAQARVGANALKPEISSFRVAEMICEIKSWMDIMADEKGIALHVKATDDMPAPLVADYRWLKQIALNLVGNAIKFTENGGQVDVTFSRLDDNHWVLEVADTGCGIPEEEQARVFEAFQRGSSQAVRKQEGSGLGLFIVKELAAQMGGEIRLQSTDGVGSTFTVVFPILTAK